MSEIPKFQNAQVSKFQGFKCFKTGFRGLETLKPLNLTPDV
jgi:hypothetical protein